MQATSDWLLQLALTQTWQLAALAVAIGIVTRLFCRRRPQLAYLLWMLVIVKAVTPPLWSSPTSVFSWSIAEPLAAIPGDEEVSPRPVPPPLQLPPTVEISEATVAVVEPAAPPVAAPPQAAEPTITWPTILLAFWILPALLLASLLAFRWCKLLATVHRASQPVEDDLARQFARLKARLGPRRSVRLAVTAENFGPAAFGWWRGTVLVPQSVLRRTSPGELDAVLAHELVHLRRFDPLVGSLQLAVQCLWWFHPAVWYANRQVRIERERSCDEAVLADAVCTPHDYARLLVQILEWRQQLVPAVFWAGMRSSDVTAARLQHVVRTTDFRRAAPRWSWLVLVAAARAAHRFAHAETPRPRIHRCRSLSANPADKAQTAEALRRRKNHRCGSGSAGQSE